MEHDGICGSLATFVNVSDMPRVGSGDGFQAAGNHRIVQLRARCLLGGGKHDLMREVECRYWDMGDMVCSRGLYEAFNSEPVLFPLPASALLSCKREHQLLLTQTGG